MVKWPCGKTKQKQAELANPNAFTTSIPLNKIKPWITVLLTVMIANGEISLIDLITENTQQRWYAKCLVQKQSSQLMVPRH